MEDVNKAVEKTLPVAATEDTGVEKKQPEAPGVDYEEVISSLLEEQKKLETERDNYRKGMLKAKGKHTEDEKDGDEEESLEAKIDRRVEEKLAATKAAQTQQQLEETVKKMAKELKEFKLAAANRQTIKSASQVTGDGTVDVPDNVLSPEALQECKAKGWSEEKIQRLKNTIIKYKTNGMPIKS